jgi:hypothetical protein
MDESILTEAERRAVEGFRERKKLDLTRPNSKTYSSTAPPPRCMWRPSPRTLCQLCAQGHGEIGETLSQLVAELKGVDMSAGKKGLFRRARDQIGP